MSKNLNMIPFSIFFEYDLKSHTGIHIFALLILFQYPHLYKFPEVNYHVNHIQK